MNKEEVLFLCALFLIGTFFVFTNLDNIYLWQDEAETALLAQNVISFGVPKAWDGKNLITAGYGADFNKELVWTFHPWAQHYITAISFVLFGKNTFFARFPFALSGLFSFFLFYYFAKHFSQSNGVASFATVFLVFSVPYLLHIRQARYYAIICCAFLWLVLSYDFFVHTKKNGFKYGIQFVLAAALLFHSNYIVFFANMAGIFIHFILLQKKHYDKTVIKHFVILLLLIAVLTLPWAIYANIFSKSSALGLSKNILFIIYDINYYIVPLCIWPLIGHLFYKKDKIEMTVSSYYVLFSCIIISNVLLFSFSVYVMRYFICLFPLFFLILAESVKELFTRQKHFAILVVFLLISTNILSILPVIPFSLINLENIAHSIGKRPDSLIRFINEKSQLDSSLYNFFYEITHDYNGPNEGTVLFLQKNSKNSETFYTNYGSLPIMFYTPLKGVNQIQHPSHFAYNVTAFDIKQVDWIIVREGWSHTKTLQDFVDKHINDYEEITLNYPNIRWGNRPDPNFHLFKTVKNAPQLKIYKRKKSLPVN